MGTTLTPVRANKRNPPMIAKLQYDLNCIAQFSANITKSQATITGSKI